MTDRKLTEAQFSTQCSYIAKNAAAWAGDILTLPENYSRDADPNTVGRFTDEMRERLDRLDKWAGRATPPETNLLVVAKDALQSCIASMEGKCEAHHKIALHEADKAYHLIAGHVAPAPQEHLRADLYDADSFMADGGDTPMTAAEAVLAWLLIEKIGVPDDVGYSPNQAQEIIVRRLDLARELEEVDAMLAEGQGDDEGHPIMPEFTKGMTTYAKVEACLHLLERRRDALHPAPQTKLRGTSPVDEVDIGENR